MFLRRNQFIQKKIKRMCKQCQTFYYKKSLFSEEKKSLDGARHLSQKNQRKAAVCQMLKSEEINKQKQRKYVQS